ncbi:c-type cytochrome [Thiohalophilus sp.]|uniref:c-type cytochrome n=1 Tax=Thiohalophilus sp. TaxID=3028392 RepID=UPI002ACE0333|nr:c-type cytochrome [Thiohalophilus sp.]MDZ7661354.1 c-type cytochrome [Thiohalophilus sp.]MDZ7803077.1 c-type cytochrome [Thiohalophilus sp.]
MKKAITGTVVSLAMLGLASVASAAEGQQTYQQACFACHGTGAAGAPKLEKSAWADRLSKGKETLYNHALNGFNAMPAKGGRADLSDADVKAAVDYMLSEVQ